MWLCIGVVEYVFMTVVCVCMRVCLHVRAVQVDDEDDELIAMEYTYGVRHCYKTTVHFSVYWCILCIGVLARSVYCMFVRSVNWCLRAFCVLVCFLVQPFWCTQILEFCFHL